MFRLVFLFLILLPLCHTAQSYPSRPLNYVTDEAGVLSPEQKQALDSKLRNFENTSSNQVFVYIAPSLNGNNLESFSQEIFHHWQIGSKNNDNGLLIAVFVNDHRFRIHTGYGLEGSLPDLLTKKIQDETMRPYFRQNDFYTGIDKGIGELMYYSAHTYEPEDNSVFGIYYFGSWLMGYIINIILLFLFSFLLFRKKQARQRTPLAKGILFAIALILALVPCIGAIFLFIMLFLVIDLKYSQRSYSSGGTYWSGDDSGYASSDSSSDFSGGGGGDSGGGGSSSDW